MASEALEPFLAMFVVEEVLFFELHGEIASEVLKPGSSFHLILHFLFQQNHALLMPFTNLSGKVKLNLISVCCFMAA